MPSLELRFSYNDDGFFAPADPERRETLSLYNPTSVAIADTGEIYVLDSGNHRIVVLEPDGSLSHTIGRRGEGPGELTLGDGWSKIALGPERIVILEREADRVKILDRQGAFISQFEAIDPMKEIHTTEESIYLTVLPRDAARPQVYVYNWAGERQRSLGVPLIPVSATTPFDWVGRNAAAGASLTGEDVAIFARYWPLVTLIRPNGESTIEHLEFPWAKRDATLQGKYQPSIDTLDAAQAMTGDPPTYPIAWDVEALPQVGKWVVLLNGGIVQFFDSEFVAGRAGRILPAWQRDDIYVFLDIGSNSDGSLLCAADPLGNQLNCYGAEE